MPFTINYQDLVNGCCSFMRFLCIRGKGREKLLEAIHYGCKDVGFRIKSITAEDYVSKAIVMRPHAQSAKYGM